MQTRSTRCRCRGPCALRSLAPATDDQFLSKFLFGSLDFLVQLNLGLGEVSTRCLRLLHADDGRLDLSDTCLRLGGVLSEGVVRSQPDQSEQGGKYDRSHGFRSWCDAVGANWHSSCW